MESLQHFVCCLSITWAIFQSTDAQISKFKSGETIVYKENATQIKVGVILISDNGSPFDMERTGAAIDIAFEKVNRDILNASFTMTQIRKVYGNICDAATAPGLAADLHYADEVIGLIGPGCSEALDPVARMSYFWNRPIVTGAGGSGMFFYKENYRTLTRLAYCECRMRRVIQTVLEAYNWTTIGLIVDRDDAFGQELGESMDKGLQNHGYYPYVNPIYGKHNPPLERVLTDTSYAARIIILCMPGDMVRQTILTAWDMGLIQTNEYVFIDVEMFPFPGDYFGNHTWSRGDDRDQDAKLAYDSVLRIAVKYAIDENNTGFVEEVKERALRDYGFDYGDEEVNFLVATFHDAVLLFGITINETLYNNGNFSNGRSITEVMMNRYIDGVSGRFYMDSNSDRLTDFILQETDPVNGTYQDVGFFYGSEFMTKIHWIPGRKVNWAGGLAKAPPDVPFCGFRNENPLCEVKEPLSPVIIALVAVLAIVTLGLLLASLMYRKMKLESALKDLSWIIPSDAITIVKNAGAASMATLIRSSRHSLTKDTLDGVSQKQEQYFIEIGSYLSQVVAMRKVPKTNIEVNRKIQMEVKERRDTTNENVTKFIGAIFEPSKVTLVLEYCQKGSLQDIIMNDSINLDSVFKTSLIEDITKGMRYIHNSPIGYHGKLTSSNCVVDSRFMLKITDFGLPSFYDRKSPLQSTKKGEEDGYSDLYWTAPEVLRNTINPRDVKECQKADVYGFGIILQEVAVRNMPFSDELDTMSAKEVIDRVISQESPPFRPNVDGAECSHWIIDMFRSCVEDVPTKRPDFAALRNTVKATNKGQEINIMDNLLKRMEMYANNLETIVAERTTLLVQEQKKTEELLLQILPRSIAEQLKQGKHVSPETFDSVSIYFSDIVGFTNISAASSPLEIVDMLNDLYTCFDSTIGHFDVYKVETIGDAYMVASGVPVSNGNLHAAEISRMSLALLKSISKFQIRHRPEEVLKLRIGLHSGSVVAGVVGLKMPRYCLFGDTVNTASRMESNGEAYKIHLSESMKVILDTFGEFTLEERGEIAVKGKGTMKTYWLLGSTREQ